MTSPGDVYSNNCVIIARKHRWWKTTLLHFVIYRKKRRKEALLLKVKHVITHIWRLKVMRRNLETLPVVVRTILLARSVIHHKKGDRVPFNPKSHHYKGYSSKILYRIREEYIPEKIGIIVVYPYCYRFHSVFCWTMQVAIPFVSFIAGLSYSLYLSKLNFLKDGTIIRWNLFQIFSRGHIWKLISNFWKNWRWISFPS